MISGGPAQPDRRLAQRQDAVSVRNRLGFTLGQEAGVGQTVMAYRDRAVPEMDDFDGMGVTGH